jgi:hypothetical protein
MAFFCDALCCQHSFRDFNTIFQNGVPPAVAAAVSSSAVSAAKSDAAQPSKLYGMDMSKFDAAAVNHFEKDWLGIGGKSWFGPGAGKLVYNAVVNAIKMAGSRQIKAVWVESDKVSVQTITDERLILLLVGCPRPSGSGKAHGGDGCGQHDKLAS